ncbi:hypothetical protein CPB83DRAFT_859313 [Crepidotus variabilis]|uniref:Rad4-domain-containing protein n=1 Tax=Crepidotus variabilis TaxID=179855 RepID=A0A9P6EAH8_9AGAR|nr:hypothetical protein CPB83DRAFT_859313 [Crepidotus variabilis]
MLLNGAEDSQLQNNSEDELDWEEVEVPEHQQHLEITLDVGESKPDANATKRTGISHAERLVRIDCHKIHTVALIANARTRNRWLNDEILQARLLSFVPLHLQNAFGAIHKSKVPDQNQRGRMFERAMVNLTTWWITEFFEVLPVGHLKNRTYDQVQRGIEAQALNLKKSDNMQDLSLEVDMDVLQDIIDDNVEPIRSAKSLMKHALMQRGSRDISAQLFTTLCRALGIPSRLVVSIQSVPWQVGIGKPKTKYTKKLKLKGKEVVKDDSVMEHSSNAWSAVEPNNGQGSQLGCSPPGPLSEKAKGKQKAKPAIRLRKTKEKDRTLSEVPTRLETPDPLTTPPVFWTEVFSKPDSKWFPIDPIRGSVNKRKVFDPTPLPTSNPAASAVLNRVKVENRMLYVLAFEEDGYARDVTRRYARQFGAKVAKMQGGSSAPNVGGGGKGRQAWWEKVVNSIHRPFRLHRDDLEDQELDAAQMMEGMPTTVSGFKGHPLYVLERHLRQTETIYPPPPVTGELGKFRGEPVYPRAAVVPLKTAENWMRSSGRTIRVSEQPMKMVKVRAGTVNKLRELEVMKDELKVAGAAENDVHAGNPDIMQGLYAYSQTEEYVPDPVIQGVVPKNNFGNIDLYVPSMLPEGAAHVPFKGVAKIARKLGFDFAEAVTGFEFKKRRAFPILEGIVVAAENEATLLEAYWEAETDAQEKARAKREERVLKQWTRLIQGLRIRQSLQEKYGSKTSEKQKKIEVERAANTWGDEIKDHPKESAGGFVIGEGVDQVVSAFHLPKNTHPVLPSSSRIPSDVESVMASEDGLESDEREGFELQTYDLEEIEMHDVEMEDASRTVSFVPKTLQQLAEDAAILDDRSQVGDTEEEIITLASIRPSLVPASLVSTPITNGRQTRSKRPASSTIQATPLKPITPKAATRTSTKNSQSIKGSTAKKAVGKRKRGAKDRSDEEAEPSGDDEDDIDEQDIDVNTSPPQKRPTRPRPRPKVTTPLISKQFNSGLTATSTPTRILRPRPSKSATQLQREREAEEAYQRAAEES